MNAARMSSLAGLSVLLAAAALGGCGGGAMGEEAKAPEAQPSVEVPPREPGTIEEAEKAIARAKAELEDTRSAELGTSTSSPAADSSTSPPPAPEPMPAPRSFEPSQAKPSAREDGPKTALGAEDRCASPCRAIASMRRAVTALCRMTGADDARCGDAKRTLTDSEKRVEACTC
jgi:hypothetical protein